MIDREKLLDWLGDTINHHEESRALVDKGVVLACELLRDQIKLGRFNSKGLKKNEKCIACNGSGYYDSHNSPHCGACNGTGVEQ